VKDASLPRLPQLLSLLVPPLAVMALIFFLSAQPDDGVDRASWEIVLRKLGHLSEYAVLTYLWWRAFRELRPDWRPSVPLLAAATISLVYAGTDELHQTFVDGRHGTPVDVLIDAAGVTLACTVAALVYGRRRRRTFGPSRPRAA
jgi:VanZ family protein